MHLLAPAGEVVLTPGVALNFVTPEVSQNHLSCSAPHDLKYRSARRKTQQQFLDIDLTIKNNIINTKIYEILYRAKYID